MVGYAIVLGIALVAHVLLLALEFEFISSGQRTLWSSPVFAVLAVGVAIGAWFANRARLPSPRETLRSTRALWLAIAIGATVGLLTILSDYVSPIATARGLSTVHIEGPAAIPFYFYGAILITGLFHFLPVATAAWLAQKMPKSAGGAVVVATVLLVAFSEDLGFFVRSGEFLNLEAGRHLLSVFANGAEAVLIYRYGLVAGLLQRGTTYLLWHIAWPHF